MSPASLTTGQRNPAVGTPLPRIFPGATEGLRSPFGVGYGRILGVKGEGALMKSNEPIAPVEQYEPPAAVELGTVAELTQVTRVCTYPSQCA